MGPMKAPPLGASSSGQKHVGANGASSHNMEAATRNEDGFPMQPGAIVAEKPALPSQAGDAPHTSTRLLPSLVSNTDAMRPPSFT